MPRIDDVQQQLQQSIDDLSGQLQAQSEQVQGQLAAQKENHDRALAQLRELITGLSVQVMQLSSRAPEALKPGGTPNPRGNNLSRLSQINFPKFEGDEVQGWIYKCEQFFELDGIGENRKVMIAAIHLSGRALVWHQSFMKDFPDGIWPSWEMYRAAILARFGEGPFDDPLAELIRLKQVGSVAQYQEQFDMLVNRVDLATVQVISRENV